MPALRFENWKSDLQDMLPEKWRKIFRDSTRNSLLGQVNRALLVFDDHLYDLQTGRGEELVPSQVAGEPVAAAELARAAARLLGGQSAAETASPTLLLLLPTAEFLATTFSMPGVSRESLKSALSLQAYSLLPGYEQPLALAVNPVPLLQDTEETALWLPRQRIDELFQAFADEGLFLAALMPRVLAAASAVPGNCQVLEVDGGGTALLDYLSDSQGSSGVIARWLLAANVDLEEPAFRDQWEEQAAQTANPTLPKRHFTSAADYLEGAQVHPHPHYSLLPDGASAVIAQREKGKRLRALSVAAGLVLLLAASPFLFQSLQARLQLATLENLREESAEARADQARVREFEEAWGAYTEYPRQNLGGVLMALQEVIAPGYLTSLEIEEGAVSLEGDSPDPQSLLEQLEQNPLFTEVDFARATNNQRYYIDLKLTTADFEAYRAWYFPDAQ